MRMPFKIRCSPRPFMRNTSIAMFCVGTYALISQMVCLREFLVVFCGNELTIGTMLGSWFMGASAGSFISHPLQNRLSLRRLQWLVVILMVMLAGLLPAQIVITRNIPAFLHLPFGEYMPFDAMLISVAVIILPTCLIIGIIFPCVCQIAGSSDPKAVGRMYTIESLGGMLGGILFSFLLVNFLPPLTTAFLTGACVLLGAIVLTPHPVIKKTLLAVLIVLLAFTCWPGCMVRLEHACIEQRWRAFGRLPSATQQATTHAELLSSIDSKYQNLALIESEGQRTLYGNGQVMFVFPDQVSAEHQIHFIMAQNPEAQSVLLIGGNPVTYLPQLLKYPLLRLVHVELDQQITHILAAFGGPEYTRAIHDVRYKQYSLDGPYFVKNTRQRFDIVIVEAPQPTTVAINRFYTLEFYRDIEHILNPDGFLYASIESSEDLLEEAGKLSASIYQSLRQIFPHVLVTGGTRNQFFASMSATVLTFNRKILYQRSAGAHLVNRYFRPEYFLGADEISQDKTGFVEQRLTAIHVPPNTLLQPVSTFYQLLLWSRFSGSRLGPFLNRLININLNLMYRFILIAGVLVLSISMILTLATRNKSHIIRTKHRTIWLMVLVGIALATTGFCGMALEIILIFMFQNFLGYIYVRMGMIVAMFMLGMMLGAGMTLRMREMHFSKLWLWMFGLELVPLAMALLIPSLITYFGKQQFASFQEQLIEITIYLLVILIGCCEGMQFPIANRMLRTTGGSMGKIAAMTNASDLFGAAFGSLAIGVFFLPLFGIAAACMLLVVLKIASILCIIAAAIMPGFAVTD